jgi:hypothetical protein
MSIGVLLLHSHLIRSGCFQHQCSDVLQIISQYTKPVRCCGQFAREITSSFAFDNYNFDIGPNDCAYIGQQSSHIQKNLFSIVDLAGTLRGQFSSIGNKDAQVGDARQLIVHNDEVLILDRKHHAIKIFSLDGNYRRKLCMAIGNKIYISGIYIFRNELYVRYYNKTIEVYTLKGYRLRTFESGGGLSNSIVVTEPNGDIILFDINQSGEIIVCDREGKYLNSIHVGSEMLSVCQVCVSPYNEIFICDCIGRVEVYAPPLFNTLLRSFNAVFTGDDFSLIQNMTFSPNGQLALLTSRDISFYS